MGGMTAADTQRAIHLAQEQVRKTQLDLSGLTVLTECASGAYAYTPIMAALAGANVIAFGKDTSFGSFAENQANLQALCARLQLAHPITTLNHLPPELLQTVDIVTNSGMLRPLNKSLIEHLKPTAMITLMWETWELHPGMIDIIACLEHGIPVIGTNEHYPQADMYPYPGMLALKLLFDLGIEAVNNELVLLGGGLTGSLVARTFEMLHLSFDWYTPTGTERASRCFPYAKLTRILDQPALDAIVCAEHADSRLLAGPKADLAFEALAERFPHVRWGHLMGNIDAPSLKASGLVYFPEVIKPFGVMTYDTWRLGFRPVIELNSAGLKVGEIAARARLSGLGLEETIAKTVQAGVGQDFEGGFLNLGCRYQTAS